MSYAPTSNLANSSVARTAVCSVLIIGAAVIATTVAGWGISPLTLVSIAGLITQLALVRATTKIAGTKMSVAVWFAFLWAIYFPIRLAVTQLDINDVSEHPAVRAASDSTFIWVWTATTAGLAAFVAGFWLTSKRRGNSATIRTMPELSTRLLLRLAIGSIALAYTLAFGHFSSGIGGNVASVDLLALAALAYRTNDHPRLWRWILPLTAIASFLGVITAFKEAAAMPIVAIALGAIAGGYRLSFMKSLAVFFAVATTYLTIQDLRIAETFGDKVNPVTASTLAFTKYDLNSGLPVQGRRSKTTALEQLFLGGSRRFGGVMAMVLLHDRSYTKTPEMHGQTILEPTLSAVPVLKHKAHLEFRTLSLGRWFSTNFVSSRPQDDPSSQAITVPGDLFLNFGTAGLITGMAIFGLAYGSINRFLNVSTATGAGALLYVGHDLIGLERNVAYLAVNAGIRIAVVFVIVLAIQRWGKVESGVAT